MMLCKNVFDSEFEITDSFNNSDDEAIVLLDSRHGWWAVNSSEDSSVFRLDDIGEVSFGEESRSTDEDEYMNCPPPHVLRDIRAKMGDDMSILPPSGYIEKIYVDVALLNHPWINSVRVYLINDDEDHPDPGEVRDTFYDAVDLIRFFRNLAGTKSDAIEDYA